MMHRSLPSELCSFYVNYQMRFGCSMRKPLFSLNKYCERDILILKLTLAAACIFWIIAGIYCKIYYIWYFCRNCTRSTKSSKNLLCGIWRYEFQCDHCIALVFCLRHTYCRYMAAPLGAKLAMLCISETKEANSCSTCIHWQWHTELIQKSEYECRANSPNVKFCGG